MKKRLYWRPYLVAAALILQMAVLLGGIIFFSRRVAAISFCAQFVSVIALLIILNRDGNGAFKMPWVLLILTAPIFGGVIYFLTSGETASKNQAAAYQAAKAQAQNCICEKSGMELDALQEIAPIQSGQFTYLERKGFPVYAHTETKFYSMADEAFPDLLNALRGAEHYIFLEYFIISQNSMWTEMLKILEDKARQGIQVRVLYDDVANMTKLPGNYPQKLQEKGIQCLAVNPFIPVCTVMMNHRDHRKIASIDGKTAFTGGFNISDEYINRIHPYGECWKDHGVRLYGDAAWQMTLFFLTMWSVNGGQPEDFNRYRPKIVERPLHDGFVQPYAHAPLEDGNILGQVYCNLLNQASRYAYIYTPYLIPDEEITAAICLAADRGVDVKLIVPGVPDKKVINQLTRAHYTQLIEHGVEIYEYEPGFVHAKSLVCDDVIASIGTGNLDCRSLYHSFEDGCLLYRSNAVMELRQDFERTLKQCRKVKTPKYSKNIFVSVYFAVLRVISPLL